MQEIEWYQSFLKMWCLCLQATAWHVRPLNTDYQRIMPWFRENLILYQAILEEGTGHCSTFILSTNIQNVHQGLSGSPNPNAPDQLQQSLYFRPAFAYILIFGKTHFDGQFNQFYCHCVLAAMPLGALWWQTVTNPPSYHSHPWSVCTFQYNPTSSAVVH